MIERTTLRVVKFKHRKNQGKGVFFARGLPRAVRLDFVGSGVGVGASVFVGRKPKKSNSLK